MAHSFLAYIDESGDDGLGKFRQPGGDGGQTHWLVISACVFRHVHNARVVGWRDDLCGVFAAKRKRRTSLSFLDASAENCGCAKARKEKPARN